MKTRLPIQAVITLKVLISMGASLIAQTPMDGNTLKHYDGTPEARSRGDGTPNQVISVLQRYPFNQCCGRTGLCCVELTLHDQDISTPERVYLEVRGNDLSDPAFPLGRPNVTGPVLFTMPLTLAFTSTIQTFTVELPCIPLPAGYGLAADFYVGIRFNQSPQWPNVDGVSCLFSGRTGGFVGEQYKALPKPMYAPSPKPGLGWSHNWTTGVTVINNGDLAWAIGAGLFEDVCQPFAFNPTRFTGVPGVAGAGVNPNFGYAGIWPTVDNANNVPPNDLIGWRVRTTAPPGSPCVLFVGFNLPVPFRLTVGTVCIDPLLQIATITRGEQSCATRSNAIFGPFGVPSSSSGICIGAQAVTLNGGAWQLSTACTTAL